MAAEAQILSILARLEAKVDALTNKPQPHLTQAAFAKRIGRHPNTVNRWVSSGLILTQKGRIPASELAKFTSQPNPP